MLRAVHLLPLWLRRWLVCVRWMLLLLPALVGRCCVICLSCVSSFSACGFQTSTSAVTTASCSLVWWFSCSVCLLSGSPGAKAYMQPSRPACLDGQGQPNVFGFPINKGTRPPGFRNWTCRCLVQRRGLPSQVLAVVRPPADASVCVLDLCAFSACTS
jgi:hypothetical protein